MTVTIHYFAKLREERGLSHETIDTEAATPAALYDELAAQYSFSLSRKHLRVAINEDFATWETTLASGDTVVFLQPAAGG